MNFHLILFKGMGVSELDSPYEINVKYISKSKHKTTHFIGNTRKQCMNNINRHNTLKLAQIIKLVQYHIEGDQGLNHCGYMLMNSTVNDFI